MLLIVLVNLIIMNKKPAFMFQFRLTGLHVEIAFTKSRKTVMCLTDAVEMQPNLQFGRFASRYTPKKVSQPVPKKNRKPFAKLN